MCVGVVLLKFGVFGSACLPALIALGAPSVAASYPLPDTLPKGEKIMLFCSVSDTLTAKDCQPGAGMAAASLDKRTSAFIQLETEAPDYLAGATPGAKVWVMIRRALTALLDATNPGRAAAPASPAPLALTDPDWRAMPRGRDIAGYFPERAQRLAISGTATVRCTVGAGGDLVGCWVAAQTPSDQDFGVALLKLSTVVQLKPTARDGSPAMGRPYALQGDFDARAVKITLSNGR